MRVADGLLKVGKNVHVKRPERPSTSPKAPPPKQPRHGSERRPEDVQYDNTDHMPHFDEKKEETRCKLVNCKGRSHIYCDKCCVHLCLTSKWNYFVEFQRNSYKEQCH
jgi:hypothetical protein